MIKNTNTPLFYEEVLSYDPVSNIVVTNTIYPKRCYEVSTKLVSEEILIERDGREIYYDKIKFKFNNSIINKNGDILKLKKIEWYLQSDNTVAPKPIYS